MLVKISEVTLDGFFNTFELYPVKGLDPYECIFHLNQDTNIQTKYRIFITNIKIKNHG